MYLYTGNAELREKLQLISRTWVTSQRADGWVGTGKQWGVWDVWEHKYTLLGLLDTDQLTGDETALTAAKKIGDLYAAEFGPGRRDLMRTGSWAMGSASFLEPMVYLYRFTGEQKCLQFCLEIIREIKSSTGPKLIAILGHGSGSVYDVVDPLSQWHNGRKSYELLSCLIGLLRMYQLTGQSDYPFCRLRELGRILRTTACILPAPRVRTRRSARRGFCRENPPMRWARAACRHIGSSSIASSCTLPVTRRTPTRSKNSVQPPVRQQAPQRRIPILLYGAERHPPVRIANHLEWTASVLPFERGTVHCKNS
jgi:Beta-L-arabinofuranosidase, GH127